MSCARRGQEWLDHKAEITMQTNKQQKAMKKMEKRTKGSETRIKNKKRIESKTKRSEVCHAISGKPSLKDREQEDNKGLEV